MDEQPQVTVEESIARASFDDALADDTAMRQIFNDAIAKAQTTSKAIQKAMFPQSQPIN